MIFTTDPPAPSPSRAAIRRAYLADEAASIEALLPVAELDRAAAERIAGSAHRLVSAVRARSRRHGGLEALLHEYNLSSHEGVVLMCLAESLLRIPDAETADRLIRDKLAHADWQRHLGHSRHLFVNASTWGLMLTGRLVRLEPETVNDAGSFMAQLIARAGEPTIRLALREAMRILGHQFVMGRTIEEALQRAQEPDHRAYRYSFDMLGEAALSQDTADRYFDAYAHAVDAIAGTKSNALDIINSPGISIKLSALHPRFEFAQRERVLGELVPRVAALAKKARAAGIGLTLDTEEADRLEPTLDVFEAVFGEPTLGDWEGFGLALQTYQKRAIYVVDWLTALARRHRRRRIMLRLVKGAYWDTEIKRAQEQGLDGYPVFTRKASTDVSYLACARLILAAQDAFYPQFATHNAHTVAAVMELAGKNREYEFQRLHGMGEALYAEVLAHDGLPLSCRVYAPVGRHADLLPYLVRRLLENGANTSFVNRLVDETAPITEVIADPVAKIRRLDPKPHPRIPLPVHLYGPMRRNARGINLNDTATLAPLAKAMREAAAREWTAAPLIGGVELDGHAHIIASPADHRRPVGRVLEADRDTVERALEIAARAVPDWARTDVASRATILGRAADLLEQRYPEFMALCVEEGGRCIPDALAEAREAVDYCRYYAMCARTDLTPRPLPSPTGERNTLGLYGRGVFACISPWNFPLAIFGGQIIAALAAGNAVIAKPAGQTPLIAAQLVQLLYEAGIPAEVLHLLPGRGDTIGPRLISDPRVAGVVFTGDTDTARSINQMLAKRAGPIVPFIAETGGQNAMIADSSALPEQVIADALPSAFNSAGQRCSALRILFLQDEIAPHIIDLLKGAMAELRVGDPAWLATDIGPLIDAQAKTTLTQHAARMEHEGKLIYRVSLPATARHGSYFGPCAFELDTLARLKGEVFGPILHVIRYAADKLDNVIEAINATGYGLTLGIHSRIEETVHYIQDRVRVGNTYVNRNMISAVVGVQPFGGEGLSGTGPKAGGPDYLHRFTTERTVTVNTAAVGGNAALLSLDKD